MDYTGLIKRPRLPSGANVPARLTYEDLVATAITREDLADDVRGINASIALIRRTRGGGWPDETVTEAFNYVDLVWHECEFRDHKSYTYVLRTQAGAYLGCCYLYPLGSRTALTANLLAGYDLDVSWWVTPDGYAQGYYRKSYLALRHWFDTELPFWRPHYSNTDIPDA